MKIAFIGLGNMGAPMARNLLKAGHALSVFDLDARAVQSLVDAGASAAPRPRPRRPAPTARSPCCRPPRTCTAC